MPLSARETVCVRSHNLTEAATTTTDDDDDDLVAGLLKKIVVRVLFFIHNSVASQLERANALGTRGISCFVLMMKCGAQESERERIGPQRCTIAASID